MHDIPLYGNILYRQVTVHPTDAWQPITVWRYTYADGGAGFALREVPLEACPWGTQRECLRDQYALEPGAHIAYSGYHQAHVVFPAATGRRAAGLREIGVLFRDALRDGYVRPCLVTTPPGTPDTSRS